MESKSSSDCLASKARRDLRDLRRSSSPRAPAFIFTLSSQSYTLLEERILLLRRIGSAQKRRFPGISVVFKISKFLEDLTSYEAYRRETDDHRVPQIKGRTAFAVVLGLLPFLAGFAYLLEGASLAPRAIDGLEHIIFAIFFLVAAIANVLRCCYARHR